MEMLSQEITELTYTNAVDTYTDWSSVTAYAVNDYARYGTYIYKCVSANTNKSPETNVGIYWVKWEVSNKLAMLDLSAQSKTYLNGGNLTVEFLQNRAETIVLGNYEAAYIKIEVLDSIGTVMWTYQTEDSINENVTDWWSYVYEDYAYDIDKAIMVRLGYNGYKIRVTLYKSANATRTAIGFLVSGVPYSMGCTLSDVGFKFISYAIKEPDDFGSLNIVKRAVQDVVDFETIIDKKDMPTVRRKIKQLYNDIIVFIVDESATSISENAITLGVIESAEVLYNEFDKTTLTWSILEAI